MYNLARNREFTNHDGINFDDHKYASILNEEVYSTYQSLVEPKRIHLVITYDASTSVVGIIPIVSHRKIESSSISTDTSIRPELRQKILNFTNLSNDWDGYNAKAISMETAKFAIEFLNKIPYNKAPTRVSPSGDGEITLIWDKGDLYADFGIAIDGTYSFFINHKKNKLYGDDVKVSSPISREVLELLGQ